MFNYIIRDKRVSCKTGTVTCGICNFSSAKAKMIANLSYPVQKLLKVCPREDRAGVTHFTSPISFELSQFTRVGNMFKNPR